MPVVPVPVLRQANPVRASLRSVREQQLPGWPMNTPDPGYFGPLNPTLSTACACGHVQQSHSGWACECNAQNADGTECRCRRFDRTGSLVEALVDPLARLAASVFLPSSIDPLAGSPGLDARTPEQALREVLRTERREAHRRLADARAAAAWWLWLAIRRERVAAMLDTSDGIRPEVFELAHAAGMRAAAAEDEAGCSEADVRFRLSIVRTASTVFDDPATTRGLDRLRTERRAKGARLRALRAIERDAGAWLERVKFAYLSKRRAAGWFIDHARAWERWWSSNEAVEHAAGGAS